MPHRVTAIAVALAASAFATLPASAAAAPATPAVAPPTTVACGTTVTHSITLAADIICPDNFTGAALTVAAGDLSIDLNGHTINYPAAQNGAVPNPGIVDHGHGDVIIENGTILNLAPAVELDGLADAHVDGVGIGSLGGAALLVMRDTQHVSIAHTEVGSDFATPVQATNVSESTITNSSFSTDTFSGPAVSLVGNHNLLRHDYLAAKVNGPGLVVSGSANQILNDAGTGLTLAAGDGNLIDGGSYVPGVVNANVVTVDRGVLDTTIESVSVSLATIGILVQSPSTQLIDDTADDNQSYGIDAVPGVTGRGNVAVGNQRLSGTGPQCLNIHCSG